MKESLESARNIHQIFIIVTTVIGIFALSLEPSVNYHAAALRELESFEQFIKNRIDDPLQDYVTRHGIKHSATPEDMILLQNMLDGMTLEEIAHSFYKVNWEGKNKNIYEQILLETSHGRYQEILQSGDTVFFPKVSSVITYDLVKLSTIPQAKQILAKESAQFHSAPKSSVDVSGLHVAAEMLYKIVPFILIVLSIYLLSLVNHIARLIKVNGETLTGLEFPWLGLFPDFMSGILTIISLFFYPISICILLVYRSQLPNNTTRMWALLDVFILAVFGILLLRRIFLLQKQIHKQHHIIHRIIT